VLITGASGLIGTYLMASLKSACGDINPPPTVYGVIHSDPPPYFLELIAHPSFHLLQGDLSKPEFWNQLPMADCIVHAAGYAAGDYEIRRKQSR
jgi:nucleoside-diphosphate-sugar epimerase